MFRLGGQLMRKTIGTLDAIPMVDDARERARALKSGGAVLHTRKARLELPIAKKPVFIRLARGLHLGYRRNQTAGTWIVRSLANGTDQTWTIGKADDFDDADGIAILNYLQACDVAIGRVAERPAANRPPAGASVYFLLSAGLIKIGWTADLGHRVRNLLSQSAAPVRLLGTVPGGREVEAELHSRFAQHRRHGEWFDPTPDFVAAVLGLLASTGLSPAAVEEARRLIESATGVPSRRKRRIYFSRDLEAAGVPYSLGHLKVLEERGEFPKRIHYSHTRLGWPADAVDAWVDKKLGREALTGGHFEKISPTRARETADTEAQRGTTPRHLAG